MPTALETMFDAEVRVEELIYIPGAVASDESFPKALEEFGEDLPAEEDAEIYKAIPALAPFADENNEPEAWRVAEALRFLPGFLVQAATPVRRPYGSGGAFTSSWGHYHTAWLHAPTEADIATVCAAWAEDRHNEDMPGRATA